MKILAIDTTSNVATAAVLVDDKLIGECILNHKQTHSQTIMPMIDTLMKNTALDIMDIDIFAAANGPGSFTGLRIGVTTIKALAHAANKPVIGVSTLEGLAQNIPLTDYLVAPIMDARNSNVYNAVYLWQKGEFICGRTSRAISIEHCVDDLLEIGRNVIFLGDGVPVYKSYIIERMGNMAVFVDASINGQRASSIAICARRKAIKGEIGTYLDLEPLYLRKSQAEREYDEKENK